jgi:hypothetical protein
VAAIFLDDKRRLEKIARNIHSGLSKKHRKIGILHAYLEESVTRQRLLKQLSQTDCYIYAIIIEKKKLNASARYEKAKLYNTIVADTLDCLLSDRKMLASTLVTLIASQRETNRYLNGLFKDFLSKRIKKKYKIDFNIKIASPALEKSLQVIDFVSWAIFRKYESDDGSCYDIFSSKIIKERLLDHK